MFPDDGFNSRARKGRDYALAMSSSPVPSFNSRARKGRDARRARRRSRRGCFNSRARKGRDTERHHHRRHHTSVSIHAPARGATIQIGSIPFAEIVSIHAPARGATERISRESLVNKFQFTRPQGARRGACRAYQLLREGFNSRARKGRDRDFIRENGRIESFNSRARKGRDRTYQPGEPRQQVSIHAPARGATRRLPRLSTAPRGFQFTRPQGARPRFHPREWPY